MGRFKKKKSGLGFRTGSQNFFRSGSGNPTNPDRALNKIFFKEV